MPAAFHICNGIIVSALVMFHSVAVSQINCEKDTTYFIPLVDLQTGFFDGKQGGLYPGGSNEMPALHTDAGISIANGINPLNFIGGEDTVMGKLVMVGLGCLDAGKSFNKFISAYNDAGFTDTCFKIVNLCSEDFGLEAITDTAVNFRMPTCGRNKCRLPG
jgi:hypothetical protein